MAGLTKQLINRSLGDPTSEALHRSLRGLREGDRRELGIGLVLAAFTYLRSTRPRRELIYRKTVPKGSAIVVHHRKRGRPKLEIKKR